MTSLVKGRSGEGIADRRFGIFFGGLPRTARSGAALRAFAAFAVFRGPSRFLDTPRGPNYGPPAQLEAAAPRSSGRVEAAIMSVDGSKQPDPRGEISPEEREALRRRSEAIGQQLDKVKQTRDAARRPQRPSTAGRAMRASAELIGGIVAGGLIGWYLDKWLGTEKPVMFVLFFLLGAAAGILNVIRVAMREKTPPAPSVPDDDEDENR